MKRLLSCMIAVAWCQDNPVVRDVDLTDSPVLNLYHPVYESGEALLKIIEQNDVMPLKSSGATFHTEISRVDDILNIISPGNFLEYYPIANSFKNKWTWKK